MVRSAGAVALVLPSSMESAMAILQEPSNDRERKSAGTPCPGALFTCGRPGRSLGRTATMSDEMADCWVTGLPNTNTLHLVSLLGTKHDGTSEYRFYSFRGSHERSAKFPAQWQTD